MQAQAATNSSVEPAVQGPGDAALSFDDLESAGVSSTTKIPEDDGLSNKTNEDASGTKIKKEVTPKEEKVEEEPKDLKTETEKAVDKKTKTFKVKTPDGKEIEVTSDVSFDVPIRGKKETVSLQDLMSNYSGKTDWSKKYSELNQDKQSFEKDKGTLQSFVDELHETIFEKKDVTGSLWLLAEAMGGDPVNVVSHFQKMVLDKAEALRDMSPEERKIKELEERESLRQRQTETRTKSAQSQREIDDVTTRVAKTLETFGIDKARYAELYHDLEKSGDVPREIPTPEILGEYHKQLQIDDAVDKLLEEVNPDLGEKKTTAKDELKKAIGSNNFSVEDMREIAIEVWGSSKSKNLAKKLKKSNPVSTMEPAKGEEPLTFDDID